MPAIARLGRADARLRVQARARYAADPDRHKAQHRRRVKNNLERVRKYQAAHRRRRQGAFKLAVSMLGKALQGGDK